MIIAMLQNELRYWCTDRTTIVSVVVAFFGGAVMTMGNMDMFSRGVMSLSRTATSPIVLYDSLGIFLKLLLFIIPTIAGGAVAREIRCGFHYLIFAYPIRERHFVIAKFIGSHAALLGIITAFIAGTVAALFLSGIDEPLISTIRLPEILSLIGLHLLPNILLVSALVMLATYLSGSIAAGFAVPVVILLIREALFRLTIGSASPEWGLLDPFGERIIRHAVSYWSFEERSGASLPLNGILIWNRTIWGTITLLLYSVLLRRFSFSRSFSSGTTATSTKPKVFEGTITEVSVIRGSFTVRSWWSSAWSIAVIEWMSILRSGTFRALMIAGTFLIAVVVTQFNRPFGVALIPATWVMLAFPLLLTSLMLQFITFLYAGILIERPAVSRMSPLIDASPIPDWTLAVSKLFTLLLLQSVLLTVLMLTGIVVQCFQDAARIEIGHYLFDLFVLHLSGFIVWGAAALLMYTITSQTGLGLIVLIAFSAGITQLPVFGLEHPLLQFNRTPYDTFTLYYSELNGYGHSLFPFLIFRSFWFVAGVILMLVSIMLWRRGYSAQLRFNSRAVPRSVGIMSVVLLTVIGVWIGLEWYVRPASENLNKGAEQSADARREPRVVRTQLIVDIMPEQLSFVARGIYTVVNTTGRAIDSVFISFNNTVVTDAALSRPAVLAKHDTLHGEMLFLLNQS
ncbi:MAG: ABC transporter permease, partial [Bacteroidota bacterium]